MKGQILDFSIQSNSGVISGDDQNRYHFTGAAGVGRFHLPEVRKSILLWMEPVRPMTFMS